jgi:hypothetical protein
VCQSIGFYLVRGQAYVSLISANEKYSLFKLQAPPECEEFYLVCNDLSVVGGEGGIQMCSHEGLYQW